MCVAVRRCGYLLLSRCGRVRCPFRHFGHWSNARQNFAARTGGQAAPRFLEDPKNERDTKLPPLINPKPKLNSSTTILSFVCCFSLYSSLLRFSHVGFLLRSVWNDDDVVVIHLPRRRFDRSFWVCRKISSRHGP